MWQREHQAGQETGKEFHLLTAWLSSEMRVAAQGVLVSEAAELNPRRTAHIEGSELTRGHRTVKPQYKSTGNRRLK